MALTGLGPIVSATPGTLVPIVAAASTLRAQSILFQALKTAGHANTGSVYILSGPTAAAAVRIATLGVPTATVIQSFSITIPSSNASLQLNQFFIDADNGTDGADVTYLGP
jgi:hypothetical protein